MNGSVINEIGVCTLSTLRVSDRVVYGSDRVGFRVFHGSPVFAGAGMQFESYLGHSVTPRQRGFLL
jgi:hypothetical protein